jgi:hypothetical protein
VIREGGERCDKARFEALYLVFVSFASALSLTSRNSYRHLLVYFLGGGCCTLPSPANRTPSTLQREERQPLEISYSVRVANKMSS